MTLSKSYTLTGSQHMPLEHEAYSQWLQQMSPLYCKPIQKNKFLWLFPLSYHVSRVGKDSTMFKMSIERFPFTEESESNLSMIAWVLSSKTVTVSLNCHFPSLGDVKFSARFSSKSRSIKISFVSFNSFTNKRLYENTILNEV